MNCLNVLRSALFLSAVGFLASSSRATVIKDEGATGDLSNNQAAPNAFTLAAGTSSIKGTVGPGDSQDWVALTIPAGFAMSSDVLQGYTSTDAQGFTGLQAGSSFIGNPQTTPSAYLGYAHFGTGAQNGPLPPTNLVGVDLLPIMGNTTDAPNSQGFTPPLAAGTYTFLIQQLGASTAYQFDFGVTAVPEPASASLIGLAGAMILQRRRSGRPAH